MKLAVNGEEIEARSDTLESLLAELGYGEALVATAVNQEFVPKPERGGFRLSDGDRIEVIAPMKGG